MATVPRLISYCAVALLALSSAVACTQRVRASKPIDVYDGFESAQLGDLWDTDRFAPGAVTMQREVVRAGRGAARIVVHSRDKFEAGINGNRDSERAELLEARRLTSRENATYEYAFSMFIPKDFPIVPTRLVIAQWKQYCPGNSNCSDDSPVVAVRYVSGTLRITHTIGPHGTTLFQTDEEMRGRWLDFKFRIRFATNENGLIKAWLGDTPIVDYSGLNAYPEGATTGYPEPSWFYFKMGLYRDVMAEPMAIYIDEYRKRQVPDERR